MLSGRSADELLSIGVLMEMFQRPHDVIHAG
jgi:hypothetical protein